MNVTLDRNPTQALLLDALRWLIWSMIAGVVVWNLWTTHRAQQTAQASVDRLLSAPVVIYEKPHTVRVLGRVYRVDRELAVPERTGR